ncbi:DHA2 family efflux MFS transporter permease subunit [Stenoxybacter acetivorans]|uniref:DHA2 family efflux MFS transporter permease subunit n=1 Tax=Stenoxybacter acetivorans TaxID=422441 RepID=UPI00056A5AAC|nr:DHA2 family efflux MFS transporter permease subunit [Stenoxybacter acetivorans]
MNQTPSRLLPLLLAIAIFMQMLDATILNTALPKIAEDLHESPLHMQSAIIAYALTLAIMMPLSGFLSDKIGTRRLFLSSLVLFVLGSLLCAASGSLNMLVISRIIQGMGGAMLTPVARLVMMRAYDKSQLFNVMNFAVMPALIGPVLGPVVGGYLVDYASWHWIFLLNIPIGLIGVAFAWKVMPEFKETESHFDGVGFFLFAAAAFCLSAAFEVMSHPNAHLFSLLMAFSGGLALIAYWYHAKKYESPLYGLDLFLVRTFRLGLIGNLVSRLGMSALPFLLPLLLQVAFGYQASTAGWLLTPLALASLVTKSVIKPIMSRFGYRNTLVVNTCLIGLLIMSLALITAQTPLWILIILLSLMGAANSLQFTAMNTITIADLRDNQASSGSSLMGVNQQLSISFGIAIGALLLQTFSTAAIAADDISVAFKISFMIMGLLTMLSAWVFARLHTHDGQNLVHKNQQKNT